MLLMSLQKGLGRQKHSDMRRIGREGVQQSLKDD